MSQGLNQQRLAVESGYWLLYRYNPSLADDGKNPLQLDSRAPKASLKDYIYNETRYRMLLQSNPDAAAALLKSAEAAIQRRRHLYEQMASE